MKRILIIMVLLAGAFKASADCAEGKVLLDNQAEKMDLAKKLLSSRNTPSNNEFVLGLFARYYSNLEKAVKDNNPHACKAAIMEIKSLWTTAVRGKKA